MNQKATSQSPKRTNPIIGYHTDAYVVNQKSSSIQKKTYQRWVTLSSPEVSDWVHRKLRLAVCGLSKRCGGCWDGDIPGWAIPERNGGLNGGHKWIWIGDFPSPWWSIEVILWRQELNNLYIYMWIHFRNKPICPCRHLSSRYPI